MKYIGLTMIFMLGGIISVLPSAWAVRQGAVTAATGYAGVAVNEGAEGGLLNPATVAQVDGYFVRLSGARTDTSPAQSGYLLQITDNTRGVLIPASLIYQEVPFEQYWPHRDAVLNLGKALTSSRSFALGVSLGYRTKPFSQVGVDEDRYQFYSRFGFNYFILNEWALGVVLNQGDTHPIVGTNVIIQRVVRMRLDWHHETVAGGLEVFLGRWFVLRMGYRDLTPKPSGPTWGIGFVGPRLSVQYAWAPLLVQSQLDYSHLVDLSLRLW